MSNDSFIDGYLRTGDEGSIDSEGFLKITGRVKDLFKTSKGKYIARIDVGDWWHNNKLEEQYKEIVANDLVLIGTQVKFFGTNHHPIWGAHQGLEQVGMFSHLNKVEMTRRYRKEHDLMGYEAEDLIDDIDSALQERKNNSCDWSKWLHWFCSN